MRALRVAQAAALYFAWVFGVGFVLGAVRVPWLVPRLGVRWAELLEMPVMAAVIVWAAGRCVRRLGPHAGALLPLAAGGLALALLVAAELAFAWALSGLSPVAYVAGRDPVSGSVYAAMLVLFALMPWLRARRAAQPAQYA